MKYEPTRMWCYHDLRDNDKDIMVFITDEQIYNSRVSGNAEYENMDKIIAVLDFVSIHWCAQVR